MTITYTQGDLFDAKADAIVNTVNCVGVMGKGVALEFKRRWPENFKAYRRQCDAGRLVPGEVFVFDLGGLLDQDGPRYLINFPTKKHWRSKSKIEYIEEGLESLIENIKSLEISSIAMPPLGCGNGGLDWDDVRNVIENKLSPLSQVEVFVYPPKDALGAPEFELKKHPLTWERALLVKAVGELEKYFGGYLTRLSLQKSVYFLQTLGLDYKAEFSKNEHGPYSESLKTAFRAMENHGYLSGYEKEKITVTRGAFAEAEEYIGEHDPKGAEDIINRIALLIEGYESPYGMELLSSVHFIAHNDGKTNIEEITRALHSWNDHKHSTYSEEAIKMAYQRLVSDGFLT